MWHLQILATEGFTGVGRSVEGSSRNVLLVRENRINPASINVTRVAIGCLAASVPGQRPKSGATLECFPAF